MLGIEFNNFYVLDRKKYILEKNYDFLEWYSKMNKQDFTPIIDIKEMQRLINKIVAFYEFKYPNRMLENMESIENGFNDEQVLAIEISKMLDMEQLKYRLSFNENEFLECNYSYFMVLRKPKNDSYVRERAYIRVYANGEVEKIDLESLKEENFLNDIEGIIRIEDLYGRFESIETDIDYSELTRCMQIHKYNVSLRDRILKLVPLAMIYSETTNPNYGYIRAKSFIRTFNKEYNLNMDLQELDEIMAIDYKDSEKVRKLLRRKN